MVVFELRHLKLLVTLNHPLGPYLCSSISIGETSGALEKDDHIATRAGIVSLASLDVHNLHPGVQHVTYLLANLNISPAVSVQLIDIGKI